ncbi:MAG: choice-of-anchor L domain-containing protein [Bacteroidia bacterium]|nr:choice-of-anchor L domain-containing protein [Bacteroidia bacterium]
MKKFIYLAIVLLLTVKLNAQLTVTGGVTATQLANILAGSNIVVSGATLTGSNLASGSFNGVNTNLGVPTGVILSTGRITDALGPNDQTNSSTTPLGTSGTAQMTALAGVNTFDAITLQFNFTVQSDMIQFDYVFASEEYPEYAPPNSSAYNDVFAFYISGPGITGEENIALVPASTSPVSINNINAITNNQYYISNAGGLTNEFDAFTTVLTARKEGLIPCQTYTLKLVIADAGDGQYNSAVFLKENSLVQGVVNVIPQTINADNIALEGCVNASFSFSLDQPQSQDYQINYQIAGTATNGIDYHTIDNTIMIPAGQTNAVVIIDPILDGFPEGQETVMLIYRPEVCASYDTVFLYIDDAQPIEFTLTETNLDCYQDSSGEILVNASGGFPPYTYHVTDVNGVTELSNSNPVTGLAAGTYAVQVYDTYGCKAEALVVGGIFDADTTFLPDGSGVSYTSTINITGFGAGETITSLSQLQQICANMEHSYLGDLQIRIIAPSGQSVILKEFMGGGTCDLGIPFASGPVDGSNSNLTNPGQGYDYCFNETPDHGTMVSESNGMYTHTYPSSLGGGQMVTDSYLPSGAYVSYQPLSNLVGAQKNGVWTLEVTDQFGLDNGYIFNWNISLMSDLPDTLVSISEPLGMNVGGFITQATCGGTNGAINITVNGNSPPFTFHWNNGAITEDLINIPSGSYSVTVTDANNCSIVKLYSLTNVSSLNIVKNINHVNCSGNNSGSVNITTSGGTPPYTFAWSNGAITEDLINIVAGLYTLTITDNAGCVFIENITINQNPQLLVSLVNSSNEICGDANGYIDVQITGGSGSYAYNWSNGSTTQDLINVSGGNYYLTVTDGFGCTKTANYSIINNVSNCSSYCYLDISNAAVSPDLCGSGVGSINITLSNVTLPSTITWSNGAITEDISNLLAGNYTVTVHDAAGCSDVQSVIVTNNTGTLNISGSVISDENCGNGSGSVNITVAGGALPYNFLWSNGATTEDINGIHSGNFSVQITDGNNCVLNQAFVVSNNTGSLLATAVVTNEICSNHLGAVNQTISGGNGTITYHWNNNATTQDRSNLVAGTYLCTITDQSGCSLVESYTLTNQPGNLSVTGSIVTNEICNNNQGAINISVTGGSGSYTYIWSNSATTEDLSNLNEGTYSCTVSDANSCQVPTGSLYVFNAAGNLDIQTVLITNEICHNHDGAANMSVTGGDGAYTYLWSTGSTSQDLMSMAAGTYTLTVTDGNGCQAQQSVTINNTPGNLTHVNTIITNEICGNGLGNINDVISGGTTPYTYIWNTGATTQDLSNVSAGNYFCTVTDNSGCSFTINPVVLNTTTGLGATNIVTNEVCTNGLGSINLTVTGGTSPFTYLWSNSAITEDLLNLHAGTYSCTVTDNSGCKFHTGNIILNNNPGTLNLTTNSINEICNNDQGSIDLTVTGGTLPLTYLWSNAATTQDISNLTAATYTVTVTDVNGCVDIKSVVITNNPGTLAVATPVVTNELCNNNLGSINLTVSGVTGTAHYIWSNAATTEDISSLNEGLYSCTVSDDGSCQVILSNIVVGNNSGTLSLTNVVTHNETCNNNAGTIDITINGGVAPIVYNWSNGLHTQDLSGLNEGSYTCTVVDANSCTVEAHATILNSSGTLTVSNAVITDEACNSGAGAINITVQGGTIPYTYAWSNGATTQDIINVHAGNFSCQIVDNSGCNYLYSGVVNSIGSNFVITNSTIEDEICGNASGSVNINISGGSLPYVYSWSNGSITEDLFNLNAGSYSVTVTDIHSCSTTGSYIVNNTTMSLAISGLVVTNENCGNGMGVIDLTYTGGYEPVSTIWSNGSTDEDPELLSAGNYIVTVTDHFGCSVTGNASVINNSSGFAVSNSTVINENCGDGLGSVDITVNGGQLPYTFLWSNGATTEDISNLHIGNYTCSVTDANSCQIVVSEEVNNVTNGLNISNLITHDDYCSNGVAYIDLTIQGGVLPYSYLWSSGQITQDLSGINAGTYICTITDQSGCVVVTNQIVIVNTQVNLNITSIETGDMCGHSDGIADITVTGGYSPYSYNWSNSATTQDISGLSAGIYIATISDATGCESIYNVTIPETQNPNLMFYSTSTVNDDCGQGVGIIQFQPAVGAYTYELNGNPGGTPVNQFSNLFSGNYILSIIDGTCRFDENVFVDNNALFSSTVGFIGNEYCGTGSGYVDISVTPSGNYSYEWSNGTFNEDLNNVHAGAYSCQITDLSGCNDYIFVTVTNNASFTASNLVSDETCGQGNGSIDITIPTAGAYSYLWSNGDVSQDISNLHAGNYTCTITNSTNCSVITNSTVENNTGALSVNDAIINDFCNEGQGMIALSINNGADSYSVLWSDGSTLDTLYNLFAGNYSVTVTGMPSNCIFVNNYIVSNSALFTVSEIITHASCSSCNDASITININGAGTNYTLNWSNGDVTPVISNILSGTYYLTVTDDWGCMLVDSFIVGYLTNNSQVAIQNFVLVYPNPANGTFNVKYNFDKLTDEKLEIYDNTGRLIMSSKLKELNGILNVDLQSSPPGIYFVRIVTDGKVYTTKVALY